MKEIASKINSKGRVVFRRLEIKKKVEEQCELKVLEVGKYCNDLMNSR